MNARALLWIGLLLLAMGGACSSEDRSASPPARTVTSSATSDPPAARSGCTERRTELPATDNATTAKGDLDGDAIEDTVLAWARTGGERVFTVVTAAGGTSEWATTNPSGADPTIYGIADADEDGRNELFVNPGRVANVLALFDCVLKPYVNLQGEPYGFEVVEGEHGSGAGCVDADGDGRRDLVGLLVVKDDGTRVWWKRTIVRLEGDRATNGPTDSGEFVRPRDKERIDLLWRVTCGQPEWPVR